MALVASGAEIGPYTIEALIGQGGMGEVYRALDRGGNRAVAFKILAPQGSAGVTQLSRLAYDARVGALLNHPNIVRVYDVAEYRGMPYVVTELLTGETLRARLRRGALAAATTCDYGRQITAALVAAHQLGVIHGDLKPENVFITSSGTVKVIDFGIAKCRQEALEGLDDSAVATWPYALLGTVGYMPPEQVRGQALDERADLFSVGAMLFEMAAGVAPFRGPSPIDTLSAILAGEPPDLRNYCDAPHDLERIIRHCLEKDRDYRFQCARDLLFNLELAAPAAPLKIRSARRPHGRALSELVASWLR